MLWCHTGASKINRKVIREEYGRSGYKAANGANVPYLKREVLFKVNPH